MEDEGQTQRSESEPKQPECASCGQPVPYDQTKSVTAGGKLLHWTCAKCSECGNRAYRDASSIVDGQILCTTCQEEKTVANRKCTKCKGDVGKEGLQDMRSQWWHERCFKCSECKGQLKVKGRVIYIKQTVYHEPCLRCCRCSVRLKQATIKIMANKIYCTICQEKTANAKCAGCKQLIRAAGGELINMKDQKFHANCFKCAKCGQLLDEYFEVNRKPYCEVCKDIAREAQKKKKRKKGRKRK